MNGMSCRRLTRDGWMRCSLAVPPLGCQCNQNNYPDRDWSIGIALCDIDASALRRAAVVHVSYSPTVVLMLYYKYAKIKRSFTCSACAC